MTRLDENGMVINEMYKRAKQNPTGTYEEMVTFQLGTIATMLTDISKSLAIIADKAESEEKSIPYLMHKEMDIPLLECQKAYDIAIDYLRRQGKVRG